VRTRIVIFVFALGLFFALGYVVRRYARRLTDAAECSLPGAPEAGTTPRKLAIIETD
jgi:hypothetical protein